MYYLVRDTAEKKYEVVSGDPHANIYKQDVILDVFDSHQEAYDKKKRLELEETMTFIAEIS